MAGAQQERFSIIGCAVTGPDHEGEDETCEDAWVSRKLSDSQIILAVGDGFGSASHAHRGAVLATEQMVAHVADALGDDAVVAETDVEPLLRTGFETVRDELDAEAQRLDEPVDELNTTLLVAVADQSGVAGAAVGDGGIIRHYDNDNHLLIPREDTPFSTLSTPVQSEQWTESYRFGCAETLDGVAVFTDGIEEFAWAGWEAVEPTFFNQVFRHARAKADADAEDVAEDFREFLDADEFRDISGDDKTLVIGTLLPAHSEIAPEDETETGTETASEADTPAPERKREQEGHGSQKAAAPDGTGGGGRTTPPASRSDVGPPYSHSHSHASPVDMDTSLAVDALEDETVATTVGPRRLSTQLSATDESCTYQVVRNQSEVAKLYRGTDDDRSAIIARLQSLIGKHDSILADDSRAQIRAQWPYACVETHDEQVFLGCLLPTVNRDAPTVLAYAATASERGVGRRTGTIRRTLHALTDPGSEMIDVYDVAIALAQFVQTVHDRECAIGDLHHDSIHVDENTVIVTDCDRLHTVTDGAYYPGSHGHSRYTPPEGIGESLHEVQVADRFGLGIHVFQLVMGGYHPFETDGTRMTTSPDDDLIEHSFPYAESAETGGQPPAGAPEYASLPRTLRQLFEQCFVEGITHPASRPEPGQWADVLASLSRTTGLLSER